VLKIRKGILVLILVAVSMMIPMVSATKTINIDYLGTDNVFGDISNIGVENVMTTGEWSDIDVTFITSDVGYLLSVESLNIEPVESSFDNGTKTYVYKVYNSTVNESIVVNVDFSSIQVPPAPSVSEIENLTKEVERLTNETILMNETIQNLKVLLAEANVTAEERNLTIDLLEQNISEYKTRFSNLKSDYLSVQNNFLILDSAYKVKVRENSQLSGRVDNLSTQITDLSDLLSVQGNRINNLENDIISYENSIEQLSSPFSMGYTDSDGEGHNYINLSWLVIGSLLSAVVILFLLVYTGGFSSAKTIKDIGNRFTIPFISRGAKPTPEEWETISESDPRPTIEDEYIESAHAKNEERERMRKEFEEEYRKKLEMQRKEAEVEKEKKSSKKSESTQTSSNDKKTNWWDTPAGQKRKEELRKAGLGEA